MMNSCNSGTASIVIRNEANSITPKSRDKFKSAVPSALPGDVISRFLAEVYKEVCSVKRHNAVLVMTTDKTGSRKKVVGIYTRVLESYERTFP
jgi:hypothetical protein